jgi:hypothetical protein
MILTASKSIKQSIHDTAKKVVDFIRSNSRAPYQTISLDGEEAIIVEGDRYSAMDEQPSALA